MGNAFQSLVLVDLLGAVQPSSLRTALVDLLVEELKPVSHPARPRCMTLRSLVDPYPTGALLGPAKEC